MIAYLNDVVDAIFEHPARVAWLTGIALAILPLAVAAISKRRAERRSRYATMAATLTAWSELPYWIRRRTSNTATSIDAIRCHIHDIQEQLVLDRVDLRMDCGWLADVRDRVQSEIQAATKPWIDEAWNTPPISTTSEMVLGGWGPARLNDLVEGFAREAQWRFGWRRTVNPPRLLMAWLRRRRGRRQTNAAVPLEREAQLTARSLG
jgi:hypothetical protein